MGLFQAHQSHGSEVGIGPFLMIAPLTFALAVRSSAQDAPQSSPDKAVHSRERCRFAMLEVFKPAAQRSI